MLKGIISEYYLNVPVIPHAHTKVLISVNLQNLYKPPEQFLFVTPFFTEAPVCGLFASFHIQVKLVSTVRWSFALDSSWSGANLSSFSIYISNIARLLAFFDIKLNACLYTVLINFSLMAIRTIRRNKMISMTKRFFGNELADGDVPADQWAMAIVKVACILIIGVVILGGYSYRFKHHRFKSILQHVSVRDRQHQQWLFTSRLNGSRN